jgi:hypothetical protein
LIKKFSADLDQKISSEPWLKNRIRDLLSVVEWQFNLMHKGLTFHNQTLIEIFSSDFAFIFSIKLRFQNFNRDPDHDRKTIPDQSSFDLEFSTGPWLKKSEPVSARPHSPGPFSSTSFLNGRYTVPPPS